LIGWSGRSDGAAAAAIALAHPQRTAAETESKTTQMLVTLGSDLRAIKATDLTANQVAICGQQINGRRGAVPLDEARVSTEVGEQKDACDRLDPRVVLARHGEIVLLDSRTVLSSAAG
jgi:hypothetical protein